MRPALVLLLLAACCALAAADLSAQLTVWDPVAPLRWDDTLALSPLCLQQMRQLALATRNGERWAEKIYDSTGRSSSRFMFGSEYWLGSRVECENINREFFRPANVSTGSPRTVFRIATLMVNLTQAVTPRPRKVSLGLCLPADCGAVQDVTQLMAKMLQQTAPRQGAPSRDIKIVAIKTLPGEYTFFGDTGFILLFTLCLALMTVTVIGTSVDLHQLWKKKNVTASNGKSKGECNGNTLSYTAQGPHACDANHRCAFRDKLDEATSANLQSRAVELLTAFSLRQNVRRFFSTKERQEGSLNMVHGLRVFSLTWVIACHTCLYTFKFSDNQLFRGLVEKDFFFQSISNGNFSVDTFFFVSGTLVAYVFLRSRDTKKPCTESIGQSVWKYISFFLYRFIRLTPPYVVVLGFVSVTMQWQASHSVFDPPTWDHLTCPKVWWRNFLYINTLFPVHQMCMIWSWYLAADTQFYVVGTALLFIYIRRPRVAVALSAVLLLSSWITTGAISLSLQHQPSIEKPLDMFDDLYDKPWTRFGPYLVGMAAGWFLSETSGALKMTKTVVCVGWTLAMSTNFGLVHALYGSLLGTLASAAYVALSHTLWAVTIAWILIACTSGHGGWVSKILGSKLLVPFSRATYCAYLAHSAIIQWVLFNMDAPIVMNRDLVMMLILGFVLSSFLLGIVISILVEAPVTRLLSLMLPIRGKITPANQCTCTEG